MDKSSEVPRLTSTTLSIKETLNQEMFPMKYNPEIVFKRLATTETEIPLDFPVKKRCALHSYYTIQRKDSLLVGANCHGFVDTALTSFLLAMPG
mmetsp:Transcript_48475/g.139406  ORF Transcript_48475/g.139406 Transcript_48475/m.139406 type:complete len:94 (+) Transcript_48475:477-758(+)